MVQAIKCLRFHGIRKLNWVERTRDINYVEHLQKTGLDQWIDLSPLSIIIGPNGGGKTTIIDLLRSLSDINLWPSLPRENYPGQDFVGFDIKGTNFSLYSRIFRRTSQGYQLDKVRLLLAGIRDEQLYLNEEIILSKSTQEDNWKNDIQDFLDQFVKLQVHYFSSTSSIPRPNDEELVKLLNELSPHFPSVLANTTYQPFCPDGISPPCPGRIGVLFKDDPGQHSYLHRDYLPLGWLQLASILSFLRSCEDKSLILLDEPDLHLHPSLQRVLLEIIYNEQKRKQVQVIIATHSSVFLNPELIERYKAKVLLAARGKLSVLSDARRALDDLGVKSSDLVQANGIIWVEGPSDRIYIKTWLKLYAKKNNKRPLVEGVDYSLVCYGGSLMKHLTLSSVLPEKANLYALNHNWFFVIDSDLRKVDKLLLGEKRRIIAEAYKDGLEPHVWITEDYTIEDYLPDSCADYIKHNKNGRLSVVKKTKIALAQYFQQITEHWDDSFRKGTDLPKQIERLYKIIENWQTPQEVIDTPSWFFELNNLAK